jgi:cytochrome c2
MTAQDRLSLVRESWPASTGKAHYSRQLAGASITRGQAIAAKCAECCNGYQDGKRDCGVTLCPLYPFMPYRAKR